MSTSRAAFCVLNEMIKGKCLARGLRHTRQSKNKSIAQLECYLLCKIFLDVSTEQFSRIPTIFCFHFSEDPFTWPCSGLLPGLVCLRSHEQLEVGTAFDLSLLSQDLVPNSAREASLATAFWGLCI